MNEFEPISVAAIGASRPARHGSPWEKEEVEKLVEEIQQGLTLSELADRHQRTPAGINGMAMRLMPPNLRPDNNARSVDFLAQYLHENKDGAEQLLVARFRAVLVAPDKLTVVEPPRDPAMRSTAAEHQTESTATVSTEIGWVQTRDMGATSAASIEPAAESVERYPNNTDVSTLVTVATADLPRERDCEVLGMRLGLDGQSLTLAEIGERYGVSRERVRQVQERALRKLARGARCEGTPGSVLKKLLEPLRKNDKVLATWLLEAASSGFEIPPRLAAKFILRTAGYTKARTAEVVDLLPAVERSRKRRPGELTRDRAAKRTESNVSRWLEHSEWPDVIAPPPPAAQLSAQRMVNESDIAGSFHSYKLGRTVNYESCLELDVLTMLECSERVAYYQEQPAQIPYSFKGRQRTYFPDVFVATTDGRGLLIEVKPTDNMALSINRAKADAGRAWAHTRGWGWLTVSDRCTFLEIKEHVVPAARWTLLESELKTHGVITWRDMLRFRAQHGLTRFDFTAYIIQSGANLDRAYRVTAPDALPRRLLECGEDKE
jgi:Sigma-70, region 4/TnsA endonuclease N terminal